MSLFLGLALFVVSVARQLPAVTGRCGQAWPRSRGMLRWTAFEVPFCTGEAFRVLDNGIQNHCTVLSGAPCSSTRGGRCLPARQPCLTGLLLPPPLHPALQTATTSSAHSRRCSWA